MDNPSDQLSDLLNDTEFFDDENPHEESIVNEEYSNSDDDDDVNLNINELDPLYIQNKYTSLPENFDDWTFPVSYRQNTKIDLRLLEYCENFVRQYCNLCPDRTKPFLFPLNELNVRKFICTTIRPTKLSLPRFNNWNESAKFIADFIEFIPLIPTTELPKRLLSPSTTLKLQKGTCFEYALLLCSILIGAGYDAYVVNGYATREICYVDTSREACPYLDKKNEAVEVTTDIKVNKYNVKPSKDLTSKYEKFCADREIESKLREENEIREKKEQEEDELYKPKPDPLYGLRIHAWIIVLAGKREVTESFFIETLTGNSHSLSDSGYLGIEGVWNHKNYWINMQDCSTGISHLNYDLDDRSLWEYVLPYFHEILDENSEDLNNNTKQITKFENFQVNSTLDYELDIKENMKRYENVLLRSFDLKSASTIQLDTIRSKALFMANETKLSNKQRSFKSSASIEDKIILINIPKSWTEPIHISRDMLELNYPQGRKKEIFKFTVVERYACFSMSDGLILSITKYKDRKLTEPFEIHETYFNRADKLLKRTTRLNDNWIVDIFDNGRVKDHLSEHGYYKIQPVNSDFIRYLNYYHKARVDGLSRRERTTNCLKEFYENRTDLMYYRETLFGDRIKIFGPAQTETDTAPDKFSYISSNNQLEIISIIEKFHRNESLSIEDDVAERIFDICEDRIRLIHHLNEERIIPCTKEFFKPNSDNKEECFSMEPSEEMYSAFEVDLFTKPKTRTEILDMLTNLMNAEESSKLAIRKSEMEITQILDDRTTEDLNVKFQYDLFDTLHNAEFRKLRLSLEEAANFDLNLHKEVELDYLAPYLIRLFNTDQFQNIALPMDRERVGQLVNECLKDFKQTRISKANLIQLRLEKETAQLQWKQQWYQINQISLGKDEEQGYLKSTQEIMFKIAILEVLLNKHKQIAPELYHKLENKLKSDKRIKNLLIN